MSVAERKYESNQKLLIVLCTAMYLAMMIGKQIFNSEIVEIQLVFNVENSILSLANLFYYLTYAALQFALVFFISKLNLRMYLGICMVVSAILTILIGVLGNLYGNILHLFIIFALNGLVQAGMYGGIISIYNKHLSKKNYFNGVKIISFCTCFSLALCYGIATFFTTISRWDLGFVVAGTIMVLAGILFLVATPILVKKIHTLKEVVEDEHHEPHQVDYSAPKVPLRERKGMVFFITLVALVYFLAYVLYYAFNNWVPTLLYNNGNGISKVYSPLASIIVAFVVGLASIYSINLFMQTKRTYTLTSIFIIINAVCCIALTFLYDNTASVIIFASLFLSCSKISAQPYSTVMAYKIRDVIEPGTLSFILNGCASISAGVAPTLSSLVFEAFGWQVLFVVLALLTMVVLALTFVISKKEKKLFSKN